MNNKKQVTRRDFIKQSLTVGALVCLGNVMTNSLVAASPQTEKGKNSSRKKTPLLLYNVQDYGCGWRASRHESKITTKNSYKLGCNLAVFAANGAATLTIGLVKHAGSWKHHLVAYDNLKREIIARTKIKKVDIIHVEPLKNNLSKCNFLFLSGHKQVGLSDSSKEALKKYLNNGGTFMIDNCSGAGGKAFDASARLLIQEMYNKPLEALPASHPIFSAHKKLDGTDYSNTPSGIGTQWGAKKAIEYVAF